MSDEATQISVPGFTALKSAGQKITMLTAYDYAMAGLVDAAGVEGILVGDSLSMVVQGHANTLPVTLDEMIYHAEMVGRAVRHALVVVDMPFPSFHLGAYKAIENAGRILKETRCQAVKLEGGAEQAEVIRALVSAGIPVMTHCGLRPQNIHRMGGYRAQRDEKQLLADAQAAEAGRGICHRAGVHAGRYGRADQQDSENSDYWNRLGAGCDGQILVFHDLLGLTAGRVPRHVKAYADLKNVVTQAVTQYRDEVRSGAFPGREHAL